MKQPSANKVYNAALYMRLSRDDENYGDSISIETQKTILRQYANEHSIHVVDEYVDDGWSGTNFERPAFQQMMRDVEAGKVNCIITKDLSRFGREHVMMDYYLEFVFPEQQVRFIAVTEGEDTEKGLSDFVPFKNLFNEWYAKDTSRKVKTALRAKFNAGERMFGYAPLGYKPHPEIKNKLIVDEETKWIIEKIFMMALHGDGATKIAHALTREKISTPGYFNYIRYGTFAHIYAGAPADKCYTWSIKQVRNILGDETYIGHTIHYRYTRVSYKNKKKIRHAPENLVRIENTQEPIVTEQVFRQVQQQIASRHRTCKNGTTQIFAGLVKCTDCGWTMIYDVSRNGRAYYRCSKYAQGSHRCTMHYIRYDILYAVVLERIRYWIQQAQLNEEALLKHLDKMIDKASSTEAKKQAADLAAARKRKGEVDSLFARMYEDLISGKITEYNFEMLSKKYQAEQEALSERIDKLETSLADRKAQTLNVEKWVKRVRQYIAPTELTAELLNALVEKIVVHEAVKDEDGIRTQAIEIYYRFVGKIEQPCSVVLLSLQPSGVCFT